MQKLEKNLFLYLVVLGGRVEQANVELHDVRWVVGARIEDTYNVLRRDWFGSLEGLHIDSYKKIEYIDGYKIGFKIFDKNKMKNKGLPNRICSSKNLWFVNIGGYEPNSMQEKHEFGLVIASSKIEAKNIAKSKWLIGSQKKHKDNISSIRILNTCDECQLIKKIDNWEIELTPVDNFIKQNNNPDWYGYQKIDK